jgi:hypothetical protein
MSEKSITDSPSPRFLSCLALLSAVKSHDRQSSVHHGSA